MRFGLKPGEVAVIARNDGEVELQYNGHDTDTKMVTESTVLLVVFYNRIQSDPEFLEDMREHAEAHGFEPAPRN